MGGMTYTIEWGAPVGKPPRRMSDSGPATPVAASLQEQLSQQLASFDDVTRSLRDAALAGSPKAWDVFASPEWTQFDDGTLPSARARKTSDSPGTVRSRDELLPARDPFGGAFDPFREWAWSSKELEALDETVRQAKEAAAPEAELCAITPSPAPAAAPPRAYSPADHVQPPT